MLDYLYYITMLQIVIGIYIVVSILFGMSWPLTMFREAGCLGKILSSIWTIALVIAILRYII